MPGTIGNTAVYDSYYAVGDGKNYAQLTWDGDSPANSFKPAAGDRVKKLWLYIGYVYGPTSDDTVVMGIYDLTNIDTTGAQLVGSLVNVPWTTADKLAGSAANTGVWISADVDIDLSGVIGRPLGIACGVPADGGTPARLFYDEDSGVPQMLWNGSFGSLGSVFPPESSGSEYYNQPFSMYAVVESSSASQVSSGTQLRWSILQQSAAAADLRWGILNAVAGDVDLRWALQQLVERDADLRWSILAQVQADADLRWSLLTALSADIDLRWGILNGVATDADFRWSIIQAVLASLDLRWDVESEDDLEQVTADLDLRWSIVAAVARSLTAQWAMLGSVVADADLRWSLLTAAVQEIEARWDVLQAVQAGAELRWDIIGRTEADVTLRWRIEAEGQFPDLTGVITITAASPRISIASATPVFIIR